MQRAACGTMLTVWLLGCSNSEPDLLMPEDLLARVTEGHSCDGLSYVAVDEARTVRVSASWYGSRGLDGLAPEALEAELVPLDELDARQEPPVAIFRIYQGECMWLDQCSDFLALSCNPVIDQMWVARSGVLTLGHDGANAWGKVTGAEMVDYMLDSLEAEPMEAEEPLGPVLLTGALPPLPLWEDRQDQE